MTDDAASYKLIPNLRKNIEKTSRALYSTYTKLLETSKPLLH